MHTWKDIDLSTFHSNHASGRGRITTNLWRLIGAPLVAHTPHAVTGGKYLNSLRIGILRLFGATIGTNVTLHPCSVYYPWNLSIGNNSWIGHKCEIYNLAKVNIGSNVCISQNVFLCTGNHDYKSCSFDLITGPISVMDAAWVCIGATVLPNVTLNPGSVVTAGSVIAKDVPTQFIVAGNPAVFVRQRNLH